MEIRRKSVSELTKVEYRACYNACYSEDNGYMKVELADIRGGNRSGEVIMLWDGPDDKTTSLKGWALVTPVRLYGLLAVTRWVMSKSKVTAMFWVKTQYRGQGLGTLLMKEVKKIDDNPHVMPHDKASGELFGKFKCQVMQEDKDHLVKKPIAS
jgi:hypothetical protein